MNDHNKMSFLNFISIVGCIGFIIVLYFAIPPDKYNLYDYLKAKRLESYYKKHLISCIYCEGTGERVEDVNKIMFDAKMALWLNKHLMVDRCPKCVKLPYGEHYDYCDKVNSQYQTFLKEYGAAGPKMSKTTCGHCMGMGQFTSKKADGTYLTQKEYEKKEKEK
ncbi:hypothetical protein EB118_07870 [bacterium]|nr:hypothetical protein [bacterium]